MPLRAGSRGPIVGLCLAAALFAVGQLVLPWLVIGEVGVGRSSRSWAGMSAADQGLPYLLAGWWLRWGAEAVVLVLLVSVIAFARGAAVGGSVAIVAAGVGLLWQAGTVLVVRRSATFVDPVRPGSGLVASAVGVLGVAAVVLWDRRMARHRGP
jgi:hypothetical protein